MYSRRSLPITCLPLLWLCFFTVLADAQQANEEPAPFSKNIGPEVAYLRNQDFLKLRQRAHKGDPGAQTRLALAYQNGKVVPQDFVEAAKWFSKAASQGEPIAEHNLGVMYYYGIGVPRDPAEAVKLLERAAALGLVQAQFAAGLLYETGNGVPRDLGRAFSLYREAARSGYAPAQDNLGNMYEQGEGIARDVAAARDWYTKSAQQGDAIGQFNLAALYVHGSGVSQDLKRAAELFRLAATQRNVKAQIALAEMYEVGSGVPRDDQAAINWLQKAAGQGDAVAQNKLAAYYFNGRGVATDEVFTPAQIGLRSASTTFTDNTSQSAAVTGVGVPGMTLCSPALDKQVIPVKLVDGMVFVPVNVNGSDVVLMLDTGATNTVISPAAVHVPVLPVSKTTTVTEGHQEVAVAVVRLDVRVGKARFDSSVVVLTDLAAAQRTRYGKFDGLLGQSILSQFKCVFLDYQNKVIELDR